MQRSSYSGRDERRNPKLTRALVRRDDVVRSPVSARATLARIEDILRRILADLRNYGITFSDAHTLNRATAEDTLREEIARALDGERVRVMALHHSWDIEPVDTSMDQWLRTWPQHCGVFVDINLYVAD